MIVAFVWIVVPHDYHHLLHYDFVSLASVGSQRLPEIQWQVQHTSFTKQLQCKFIYSITTIAKIVEQEEEREIWRFSMGLTEKLRSRSGGLNTARVVWQISKIQVVLSLTGMVSTFFKTDEGWETKRLIPTNLYFQCPTCNAIMSGTFLVTIRKSEESYGMRSLQESRSPIR